MGAQESKIPAPEQFRTKYSPSVSQHLGRRNACTWNVMVLVWRVMSPLQTTYLSVTRLEQALQTFHQINRLMTIKSEHTPIAGRPFHRKFLGHIVLNRLIFRYPRRIEPALRGVQLAIKPGEVIAVTGPSG